jgi:hypothetical protein
MQAPHRAIAPRSAEDRLLISLLDSLWERYRSRVSYARTYEELVSRHGATFLNDHMAFRTIAWQDPAAGIFSISRLFESLGYKQAGCYEFPDKKLSAIHYAHSTPGFPKLFISQLKSWELSPKAQKIIAKSLNKHRRPPPLGKPSPKFFADLPWPLPQKKDVESLNEESQFGAWVLLNGYDVNHFTASIDLHGAGPLEDIEKTVAALRAEGVPMKPEIEGERGSRLRQSATEAVVIPMKAKNGSKTVRFSWPYAYFELAERPVIDGKRFEGFLGGQATNLFEMTRSTR